MARSFREQKSPLKIKALVFPLLMGTVGWFALRGGTGAPVANVTPAQTVPVAAAVSSTLVLLERPAPKQDRDERFIFNVEAGTVAATSSEAGWRINPSSAQLTRRTEDGAWLLVDGDASVVLRDRRGASYKDPVFVGPFDRDATAIIAIASDRRVLLSVARNGSIRELATLSDQTSSLGVEDGRAWLMESAPQEGIEIPPHGPSSVWSVSKTGTTSTALTDDRSDRLVNRVLVNGKNAVLGTDKNDMWLTFDGDLPFVTEGQPLMWLPNNRLLIVQRGLLCLVHYPPLACGPKAPDGVTRATLLTP
jgi:hypothetical protein